MISIERIPWDDVPWSALDRFHDRNVFQTRPWLNFVATSQSGEPVVAAVKQDGAVVGYFTGLKVKRFGIKILGSPFRGWTTVCMGFNLPRGFPRLEALKALSSFAFEKLGCHHLEVVDRYVEESGCARLGYSARTRQTYEVDLTPSEDEMFMKVTGACRRCIRKAARSGVVIEEASGDPGFADEYHAQLHDVFNKQSLVPTYGVERVRQLIRFLHPTGNLLLLRAKDASGNSMATGIFPAFNDTMYYWGGASWRRHQILRPNEPLMWHAMMYWKARGMTRFDMLGAGRQRDSYKMRYGAVLVPSGTHLMNSKYAFITPLRNIARGIFELRQTVSGRFGSAARTRE